MSISLIVLAGLTAGAIQSMSPSDCEVWRQGETEEAASERLQLRNAIPLDTVTEHEQLTNGSLKSKALAVGVGLYTPEEKSHQVVVDNEEGKRWICIK